MPEQNITSTVIGGCKRFECQVIGLPRPSIRWYKDGVNVTTHPRYKCEYTPDGCVVLVLDNVTLKDEGVYECRAQNSEGSAETSAQLYVKETSTDNDKDLTSIHEMAFRRSRDFSDRSYSSKRWSSGSSEDSLFGLESTRFYEENSSYSISRSGDYRRRATFDGGITSRGNSFSSESDLTFSTDSTRQMRQHLHGSSDHSLQSNDSTTMKFSTDLKTEKSDSISAIRKAAREKARARQAMENGGTAITGINLDKSESRSFESRKESTSSTSIGTKETIEKQTYSESFVSVEQSSKLPDATVTKEESKSKTVEISSETMKNGEAPFEKVTSFNVVKEFETSKTDTGENEVTITETETYVEEGILDAADKEGLKKIKDYQTGETLENGVAETGKNKTVGDSVMNDTKQAVKQEDVTVNVSGDIKTKEIPNGTKPEKEAVQTNVAEMKTTKQFGESNESLSAKVENIREVLKPTQANTNQSKEVNIKIEETTAGTKTESKLSKYSIDSSQTTGDVTMQLEVTQPARSASEERRKGRMIREEEHPGKLDHTTKDDTEERIMAGKYLSYETSEQEEFTKHEVAHEVHFMYKADSLETSTEKKQPVETVVKEVSTSYEQYQTMEASKDEKKTEEIEQSKLISKTESDVALESKADELDGPLTEESVSKVIDDQKNQQVSTTIPEENAKVETMKEKILLADSHSEDIKKVVQLLTDSEINVEEGEQAKIQWKIAKISIEDVYIFKAGTKVTSDDTHIMIKDAESGVVTFKIVTALQTDSAVYSVRIKDAKQEEGIVNLNVLPKPLEPVAKYELLTDSNITLQEGERLEIRWKVTGIQLDRVSLFKDGTAIKDKERLRVEKKDNICTLIVNSISVEDGGVFSLRSQNSENDEGQTEVKVMEVPKVEVIGQESEIVVKEKEKIVIKWKITGVDVSRITLSKNGSPVKQDDRCKLTLGTDSCILNISSASLDDDGVYTISISGSEVTGCQIKVKVIAIKESVSETVEETAEATETTEAVVEEEIAPVKQEQVEKVLEEIVIPKDIAVAKEPKPEIQEVIQLVTKDRTEVAPEIEMLQEQETVSKMEEKESMPLVEEVKSKRVSVDETDSMKLVTESIGEQTIPEQKQQTDLIPVPTKDIVPDSSETPEVPVSIKALEKKICVKEGDRITLQWKVSGISLDDLNIGKVDSSDQRIKISLEEDIFVVAIESARMSDQSVYGIKVKDSDASEAQVEVKVVAEPKVELLSNESNITVSEGKSLNVKWKITGASESDVFVLKGDAELQTDEKHKLTFEGQICTLAFESISTSDQGPYCIKVMDTEFTGGEVQVMVKEVPKIELLMDEQSITLTEGETLELKWKITGASESDVIILKGDSELQTDEKHKVTFEGQICTLSFESISTSDQGPYCIKVKDTEVSGGEVQVKVKEVPKIEVLTDEQGTNLNERETLELKWKIIGASESDIIVLKGDSALQTDEKHKLTFEGQICTLAFESVSTTDQGPYCIKVKDAEVMGGEVQVKVKEIPKIEVLTDEQCITLTEGETLELKWKITGVSESDVILLKGDSVIQTDEKHKLTFEGQICTLTFESVSTSDQGPYCIKVKDAEVTGGEVQVKVKEIPKVQVLPDKQYTNLKEGEMFELKWKITGLTVDSTFEIFKDDNPVIQDSAHIQKLSDGVLTYTVSTAASIDEGIYCVKVTGVDQGQGQVEVKVNPAPKVYTQQSDEVVKEGESLTMTWEISGASKSEVRIYKDGSQIKPAKNLKLKFDNGTCRMTLNQLSKYDEAAYSIKIKGLDGEQGQIKVKVISEPMITITTEENEKTVSVGESVSMAWKISGASKADIAIYKDGSQITIGGNMALKMDDDENLTLKLEPVSVADEGTYSIKIKGVDTELGHIMVKVIEEGKVGDTVNESVESFDVPDKSSDTMESETAISEQLVPEKSESDKDTEKKKHITDIVDEQTQLKILDKEVGVEKSLATVTEKSIVETKEEVSFKVEEGIVEMKSDMEIEHAKEDETDRSIPAETVKNDQKNITQNGQVDEPKLEEAIDEPDVGQIPAEPVVKTEKEQLAQVAVVDTEKDATDKSHEETVDAEPVVKIEEEQLTHLTDVDTGKGTTDKSHDESEDAEAKITVTTEVMERQAMEGQELSLVWTITGVSKSDVRILKDGSLIKPGKHMKLKFINGECSLTLNPVTATDEGSYSIKIRGIDENKGQIRVKVTAKVEDTVPSEELDEEVLSKVEDDKALGAEVDKVLATEDDRILAIEDDRVVAAEDDMVSAAEDDKVSAAENDRVLATEDDKVVAAQDERVVAAEDDKVSAAEDDKVSATEDDKVLAAEDDKVSAAEDHKVSEPEDDKLSATEDDKVSAAEDDKVSAAEDHKVSEPEDDKLSAAEDDKVSAAAEDDKVSAAEDDKFSAAEDNEVSAAKDDKNLTAEDDKVSAAKDVKALAAEDDKVSAAEDDKVLAAEEVTKDSDTSLALKLEAEKLVAESTVETSEISTRIETTSIETSVKTQVEQSYDLSVVTDVVSKTDAVSKTQATLVESSTLVIEVVSKTDTVSKPEATPVESSTNVDLTEEPDLKRTIKSDIETEQLEKSKPEELIIDKTEATVIETAQSAELAARENAEVTTIEDRTKISTAGASVVKDTNEDVEYNQSEVIKESLEVVPKTEDLPEEFVKPLLEKSVESSDGIMLEFKVDVVAENVSVHGSKEESVVIDELKPAVQVTAINTDKVVKHGESLSMAWKVKGVAKSDVRILKDGAQIKPARNLKLKFVNGDCTLTLNPVSATDEATYSIKVKGLDQDQGHIKVKVTPKVKEEVPKVEEVKEVGPPEPNIEVSTSENEKSVTEGETLQMIWNIKGAAKSDVRILKDGSQIKPSGNMKLTFNNGDCTLTFNPVSPSDEAVYSVKVKGLDQEVGQIKVKVKSLPKVTTADNKKTVEEGGNLSMVWNISGAAKSDIRILKDGAQIRPAKNMKLKFDNGDCTLTFDPVSTTDEATYGVKVKGLEKVQGHINVRVTPEPKVETLSCDKSVVEGETLELKWKVTGAVETDISICKNEQQISKDATHNVTVNGTEIALQIEPVSKDDEGCYQIKVKGHESKVQGQVNVQVNVKEEPEIVEPKTVEQEAEVTKEEGYEPVCEVLDEWPDPEDLDELDTAVKVTKPKVTEAKKPTEKAQPSDKPKKDKPVQEEVTVAKSKELHQQTPKLSKDKSLLRAKPKPIELIDGVAEKFVNEGEDVEIQWKLNGATEEEFTLCKDGFALKADDNLIVTIKNDICSLKIQSLTLADKATYSVKRLNADIHEGQIFVKVSVDKSKMVEPSFVQEPKIEITPDRRLSLTCAVTGYPEPEVTWFHKGQQLGQDALWDVYTREGYHYLVSNNRSMIDIGEIVCRAQSEAGYQQCAVTVTQEGDHVYCDRVLPPVSVLPEEYLESSPILEVEISETSAQNLQQYTVVRNFQDNVNGVSLLRGDGVQLLAGDVQGSALTRLAADTAKTGDDLSKEECRNLQGIKIINQPIETLAYSVTGTEQTTKMPERRHMTSSSPQMTSTPKVKRKGYDDEDTREMRSRLGLKDSATSKTEVSREQVELTSEYTDGTTRPTFKKRLRNLTANEGELAQLECVVSGSPLPKVLWLKNNRPLKASDGCKVIIDEDKNILVFPAAKDDDVGIYTARAMNVNGSIMCSAEFTLKEGKPLPAQSVTGSPMDLDFTTPAYFFQMSSCEVAEGRLARFDCRVVAYPKPEIVWMRDGKVIETSDRFKLLNFNNEIYSLLIQDVQLTDTGRYTCWARNKFGEAMTEAYLNVISFKDQEEEGDMAPKFLTKFYDQQTTEGSASDFKCLVAGRPEPSVTWLLDDIELKESPGVRMRKKDGVVSLEFKSPKVDQTGQYTCQLKNTLGEATCSAKLTVIEDKLRGKMLPKFLKKFDHVNAKEGEEAKFTCVVVGEPKPNVVWMYNHKPISDTNRHYAMKKEGDAYSLIIKDVRFDDKGIITCKASNEEGEVYVSANIHIREGKKLPETPEKDRVTEAEPKDSKFGYVPTFTKRLEDVSAKEGTSARFECRVMGIPEPEVSWMKDGRVILPGGRYHMTYADGTCRLMIDNVTSSDTGVYTCIISNSQGKSSSTASLKLEREKKEKFTPEKPVKRELFTPDKYGTEDKSYTRPAKRPYEDLERIEDAAKKFADLPEMRAPPRLPSHRPIITDMGEDILRLAWRPAETYQAKRAPPVSYRLEAKELPGKDWMPMSSRLRDTSHYLSELPLDRDYMIRVRAENDFGISEPTEPLWLPRARAFPGVPVMRPEIVEVEDTRAKLSWTRVDIPSFGLDEEPLLYMLEVEEPPYDWRTIARDLDDTEYIVEGLKPGKDYRFRIRAKTPAGVISEPSPAASLYSTLARVRAPVDRLELVDYEPDSKSINLQWQRVDIPPYSREEEPLLYMLEYQEPPMPEWRSLVTGIPTTKYRVMHLDPDREYNFRVRAVTPYGVSPPSPVLPVALRKTQIPSLRPLDESVIISEIEPDSLRLSWKRPMYDLATPVTYKVEMLEFPLTDWKCIASSIPETTYRVLGLRPNRDYQFRVTPQVDRRYLDPMPPVSLTSSVGEEESATRLFLNMLQKQRVRPRLPLAEPTLRELTAESVSLTWKPAEIPVYQRSRAPLYYTIEMQELPSSTWVPVARRVPDTTYTVTGLRPNLEYKFRVKAEIDGSLSEPSLAAVLHRRPVPKFPRKEPTIKDISPNIVQLSWQPAMLPTGFDDITYRVEIQSPPGISTWNTLYANHPTPSVRLADLRPDLDYLVRVRAVGKDFVSEPTMPVYIPRRAVPPKMPQEEPYCVDINPDSVKLQWRSADLPTHIMDYSPITYRLEAQEMPSGEWITVARGIPHTDFKVTGLHPLRDYSFRVRAENDYGVSDPTRPVAVQKRAVAPLLPHEEPIMFDVGQGSVRLTWRPASLPSHVKSTSPITYTIFVQELPFKTWRPLVKKIPHTSYYLSGLQPDKEYNFRIQAENEHGQSRPTEAVYLPKYTDIRKPISIPEVSDFDEDLTFVKLRWKPRASPLFDKSPHRYQIETWEPVKRVWKPVARGIQDTSYQLRDLPKLPDHLFRVRMETEQAELSEPSLPVSVSKHYNYPKRPVYRPQLFEFDNDSVRLSWQPAVLPEGVSRRSIRYVIEQREIPDMHWYTIDSDVTETSYRVRGLRPKSEYEFRIRVNMNGTTSEPSFPVALYRRPVIPRVQLQAPEVYDVDDTTIQLRWNKVDVPTFSSTEEPLLFMIERQTLPGYRWEPVAMDIADTTYTVRNLKPYQDYNFRVRGVYPSGYTDPSPYVPVFRRPIRRYVPIARPEIWEEDPYSARLRWHRAYIPRYYRVPLRYRIEMQEASEVAADWKPVATDITEPDVTVNELSPRKDYNFRIRAQLENGDLSDPTPPIQYHRSKVPMSKESFTLAEYKPVEYDHVSLNRTYIDHLTKYVPPRLPIDKPDMIVLEPETVELSWRSASVPESIRSSSNLTYTIEVRNPPHFDWRELISGLKVLNHKVQNLHNKIDYVFRVRAWNEYGCSEPSLPVSLYRPIDHNDYEYVDEDAEFEREWELRFGQQDGTEVPIEEVPPKLPIDTPRINTQTETSIWFTWLPARIPAYATQTPITYVIEMREPPNTSWRRDVTGLVDCQYIREGLDPKRDYHIRIRAETEFGTSEPTLPIMIQRSRGSRPGSRLSSMERELKEDVTVNTSYLDNLTSTGPPRMTSNRPQCSDVQPKSLTLSWAPSRVPSYVKSSGVSYIIEKREPPGHIWCVVSRDIAETSYQVLGLNPEQDYMFRVRAKNEHGISDPTLPVSVYRERDDYAPQKTRSRSGSRDSISAYLSLRARRSSSIDYGSGSGGLKTPDEESPDKIPRQPEYIETTYDTQYGVEGKKGKITLRVKGYPLPTVHWYFGEEKLKYGDQYNAFITSNGAITLEIKNVNKDSAGEYKCYAENEHGAAVKVVTFDLAEPPTVLEPLADQVLLSYNNITMKCKVDGYPNPVVKWMKDWKPLAESSRIVIKQSGTEEYTIEITNGLVSDSGVYACVVENAAGKVTTACRLTVEDTATPREVILKSSPIEEFYTVLEEVRRGEHGVTRRVVELSTGNSYEAQFIYMRNRAQKNFFLSEFEVLRTVNQLDGVLKIHDAFETERSLVFVTEPLSGIPLLEKIAAEGNWTEADVAVVIKNLLNTIKEFEILRVLYLDMRPSNIRMCGGEGKEAKLVNFAMSRIQDLDEDVTHNYGTVGYASPEQITNDVLTGKTDMWGIGVLTYILLTGNAPFTGETDSDVLNKTAECLISFDDEDFGKVSKKAQDFIKKLLIKQQSLRMSVDECMRHPWLKAEETGKVNTDKLLALNNAEKAKAAAIQVQTTAVLQSLSKIRHGTAALYQPAIDTNTGEIIFPDSDEYGDYLDEDAWYEWQLQYCDDPDSQNFPLMDKNFTLRESKHAAEKKREQEVDDTEESEGDGSIYFRNKILPVTFSIGDDVSFMCTVVSPNEKPIVTWYRDETLLSEREAYRTEQLFSEETGIAQLTVQNAKDYDGAVYKCVARNKEGRVSCEARLLLGDKPGKPGRPVVIQTSGSEAFLTWSNPVSDGNAYILGYRVDYRKQGTTTWVKGPYMTEEYALVSGLTAKTSYVFRVSCHNRYGTSPFSWASIPATTLDNNAPPVAVAGYLQPLLRFSSFTKQQLILPAESRRPSLSVAPDAKVQKGNPADFYDLGETVSKGKYGEYKLCTNKSSNRLCVAKVMPFTKETHVAIKREFEILKTLRQLHIITVFDAYIMKEFCYVIFEHLSGLNIIQYLCLQKSYKEEIVARVVKQILDALQYLQSFGIVHLNLQPSSVAMTTRRRPHIKLRDFTVARKLKDGKVADMKPAGYPDFVAPEVIKGETVSLPADLWSLGALTFTLLSGVSAFGGSDLKETLSNILYDRYKASDMYDNVSKESIKFVNKLLRRLPKNRPTVTKCLKSRWLQLSDNMLNSRTTRVFHTERLRDFLSEYSSRRSDAVYMDIGSIPLEELPKPTPGPIVQPILSDKVANRYEFKPKTTVRMEREENEKQELEKPTELRKPVQEELNDEVIIKESSIEEIKGILTRTAPEKHIEEPVIKKEEEGQIDELQKTSDDVKPVPEKHIEETVVKKEEEEVKIDEVQKTSDDVKPVIEELVTKENITKSETVVNTKPSEEKVDKTESAIPKIKNSREEPVASVSKGEENDADKDSGTNKMVEVEAEDKNVTQNEDSPTEISENVTEKLEKQQEDMEKLDSSQDKKKPDVSLDNIDGNIATKEDAKDISDKQNNKLPDNDVQGFDNSAVEFVNENEPEQTERKVTKHDETPNNVTDTEVTSTSVQDEKQTVKEETPEKPQTVAEKIGALVAKTEEQEVKSDEAKHGLSQHGDIATKDSSDKHQELNTEQKTEIEEATDIAKSESEVVSKEEEVEVKQTEYKQTTNEQKDIDNEAAKVENSPVTEVTDSNTDKKTIDEPVQREVSDTGKPEVQDGDKETKPSEETVVEEESITPKKKLKEEADICKETEQDRNVGKEEKHSKLSDALNQQDRENDKEVKQVDEKEIEEPVKEDEVVSEQRKSVESEPFKTVSDENRNEANAILAEDKQEPTSDSNTLQDSKADISEQVQQPDEDIPAEKTMSETQPMDEITKSIEIKESVEVKETADDDKDQTEGQNSTGQSAVDTENVRGQALEQPVEVIESAESVEESAGKAKDQTESQNVTGQSVADVENVPASEQPQEEQSNDVTDDQITAETTGENLDSDDSEIQKLEKDAAPEKLEQVKEEEEAKGVKSEDAKKEDTQEKTVKEGEPNEEKIADLCTTIDDALMFC